MLPNTPRKLINERYNRSEPFIGKFNPLEAHFTRFIQLPALTILGMTEKEGIFL